MSKCCFCGKDVDYKINGNDPRPIKIADEEMPICCDECNAQIVIPTRLDVWKKEDRVCELEQALIEENYKLKLSEKICELLCEDMYNIDCDCVQADYENYEELMKVYENIAKEMMKSE